jgi:hypothetical protein
MKSSATASEGVNLGVLRGGPPAITHLQGYDQQHGWNIATSLSI